MGACALCFAPIFLHPVTCRGGQWGTRVYARREGGGLCIGEWNIPLLDREAAAPGKFGSFQQQCHNSAVLPGQWVVTLQGKKNFVSERKHQVVNIYGGVEIGLTTYCRLRHQQARYEDVMSCSLVGSCHHFGGTCCLYLRERKSGFLRNVCSYLPDCTVAHSRTQHSV